MNLKIFYIVILLLFMNSLAYAQTELKGKIMNSEDRSPVAQAQISSPAAGKTSMSDENGEFTISLNTLNTDIQVVCNGFITRTVYIGNRSRINVFLIPETTLRFSEVLKLPKGNIPVYEKTGSSVTLNKDVLNTAVDVPDEAMHGMVAGLQVLNKSGMPGEGAFMNIRGIRSLTANNTPLIVVDGMPYLPDLTVSPVISGFSRNMFTPVHLKEIESISVVKGSDASMYGSLGSNGVILINTEQANDLETRVEFHTTEGIGWMKKRIPVMNGAMFRNYIGDVGETAYPDLEALVERFPFLKDDPSNHYNYVYDNDTDWQDEVFTQAITSENILKIKGGDAIANYALSVGYFYNKGILENTELSKYFTHLNAKMTVLPKLDMFASIGFTYSDNQMMEQGMEYQTNPILTALHKSPLFGIYEKDANGKNLGRFSRITNTTTNKVADIIGVSNPKAIVSDLEATNTNYDVLMNAGLNYRMNSKIGLNALIGVYYNYNSEDNFIPGKTSEAVAPLYDGLAENTVRSGVGESYNIYFNVNGTYKESFNNIHNLDAMLGYQLMISEQEYDFAQGINTPSDFYKTLGTTTGWYETWVKGYMDKWNWMNIYLKANYNYKKQLYFGAGVTVDASSSIGENSNLFAFYPTVNAAWNIKNSSFLRDVNFIDHLALRGEYSQLANSHFSSSLSRYHYNSKLYRTQTGMVRTTIPNTKLKAEVTHNYGVGIDFSTLGRKLDISADLFTERTKDMLTQKELGSAYGFGYVYDNAGEIKTQGIEVSLHAEILNIKNFNWVVGGNIASFKSEIKSLGGVNEQLTELSDGAILINRVGETPYSFYGVKAEKVFFTQAEADAANLVSHTGSRFNAGDIKFKDAHKDGMIDDNDYQLLGSAIPDFFGGFYSSFAYKNIGLTAHFTYSYGNKIYNAVRRSVESLSGFENQSKVATQRWTYDGQETNIPRAQYGDAIGNSRFSDRWIEDGSFLKLKYITLSYTLPRNLSFINQAQIYLTGENLFSASKYLGYDPEFSYSYNPAMSGIDQGKVPLSRSVRLGIRMMF